MTKDTYTKMESQAMHTDIKISNIVIFLNSHIGPSISPSIGPKDDPRFLSKVVVPDLGLDSWF